ncbi:MAG: type I-C CRISPR-associated protein Cas8c/Csd1, partial [Rubrivivax sp.]|nr:type I-C CRISPR-associated protein Cas8c/Csd1 [Rubrivivax sp.]
MILQELVRYYDRQRALPESDIAPPGWVRRPLDYVLVLSSGGECINLVPQFVLAKSKRLSQAALLPAIGKQALKHTNSGKDANLLWDNASFALGWGDVRGTKLTSFAETIAHYLCDVQDEGVSAVNLFLAALVGQPDVARRWVERFDALTDFEQR